MRDPSFEEKKVKVGSRQRFSISLPEQEATCAVCGKPLIFQGRLYEEFWHSPKGEVCDDCARDIKKYLVLSIVQINGRTYNVYFKVSRDQRAYLFESQSKDDYFIVGWFRTRLEGWISVGNFSLLRELGLPEPEYPGTGRARGPM